MSDITTAPAVLAFVEKAPACMRAGILARLRELDAMCTDTRGNVTVAMVATCAANRVDHVALAIGGIIEGIVVEAFDPFVDDADACAWFNAVWRQRAPKDRFTDYDRGPWLLALITACAQALMDHHRQVPA